MMTHGAKDCVVPFLANQPNPSPTNPPLLLVHAALSRIAKKRSARETWRDCTVYTDGDGRPEEEEEEEEVVATSGASAGSSPTIDQGKKKEGRW